MSSGNSDRRRELPALDRLLADPVLVASRRLYGSVAVATQARQALATLRRELGATDTASAVLGQRLDRLPGDVAQAIERALGAPARRVLNATGIFLHTNLGRAPLPREVAERLAELSTAACDLEFDLVDGRRGSRSARLAGRLTALTGASGAVVVNNNAAALLLAVTVAAAGREVVVSRGELVEIGGSFRIPEIVEASGARLREVGTTNRTRLEDYAEAIHETTGAILKVHPSNYRMTGFTSSVSARELVPLAQARAIPLIVDEGAGLLRRPLSRRMPASFAADHETVAELLAAGADLVCSSGDKLLGGPQAGLLLGRSDLIEACAGHPLYRALRPGRLVALALDEILRRHLAGESTPLDALWPDPAAHALRVASVASAIGAEVGTAEAFAGGGAAPGEGIPGPVLVLKGSDALAARLRAGAPPVVGYLREGRLLLDLRTVDPADDDGLLQAVQAARLPPRARESEEA